MKISVSTLGCPAWTLDEIITRCSQYGYDAIELRGIGDDLDLTRSPDFATPTALAAVRRRIQEAGLAVSAVDSSAKFSNPADVSLSLDQARAAIDVAAGLGAHLVRVFGGAAPDGMSRTESRDRVVDNLRIVGDYAAANGDIIVLLETHDAFSTGAQVREVLQTVEHPRVAALWDFHHPYRHGESPAVTAAEIGPLVKLAHVKDSVPGGTYCLLGDGDIPVPECLRVLYARGYSGYVSVEWEKRWVPALPDPEITFPQYARLLREYLAELK